MTKTTGLLTGSLLLTLCCGITPVSAATAATANDFFRTDELSPRVAMCGMEFHLPTVFGPTGMNGWLLNDTLVVREVENDSPSDGIVLPNDMIRAANGVTLGDDPLKTFGEQIEPSEKTGKMVLTVVRSGQEKDVTIPMRKLGAFGRDWPYDCAKSRAIHIDACEYLAAEQNPDGLFDGRTFVGFGLNGLTWLAANDPKYWENARRLAYGYRKEFNPAETSTVNWGWGYMGIFLAEYYFQTGDDTVLPLCGMLADAIERSQFPCGSWGHGPFAGRGYVQGGLLNNAGLACWMALILMDEAGVPVSAASLAKSKKFFSRFAHRGGVPYGDHRPEHGGGNGKNALAGICFRILGDQAKSEYFARWVTDTYRGRNAGHTGGYMGFFLGNMQGSQNPHYPDYRRMLDHWTWLMNVSRRWDGGFLVPASVIGKTYTYRGPLLSTGGMSLLYAMPGAQLRMHGAARSVFAKADLPTELSEGITLHRASRFDELRKLVKPTSDDARQLLAAAAFREKDLELTHTGIEAALEDGNATLALKMTENLMQYAGRDVVDRDSLRWRVTTDESIGAISKAGKLYEPNKWLTYTHPEARAIFEELASDDKGGIYRTLARRELATPPENSSWAFYCELMWKTIGAPGWEIDDKARAAALRVAGIHGGAWPRVVAINTLHQAGILTEQLGEWTPLFASHTGGYPGPKPTWTATLVAEDQAPPKGWSVPGFDDSGWQSGPGPIGHKDIGIQLRGNGTKYVRIAFDCDRTDLKRLKLGIRVRRGNVVGYLNGEPVLWAYPTQGPRQSTTGLTMIDMDPENTALLRKGRNVFAFRSSAQGVDLGLYGAVQDTSLSFVPRPDNWLSGMELDAPNLFVKTPKRPVMRTVLAANTTGLNINPPGKPNEDMALLYENMPVPEAKKGRGKTKEEPKVGGFPLEKRAQYFGHYHGGTRRRAAFSMMAEGANALPFIRKALKSDDVRVIRAGCDALAGYYRMNGRGANELRSIMTPDIAAQAISELLPLLDHEDMYVRAGALLALSSCGKAVAPHFDQVVSLADEEDWWVREGVAHVLNYTGDSSAREHVEAVIRNFITEPSYYGRNRQKESLVTIGRSYGADEIVEALLPVARSEGTWGHALAALGEIGPNAKGAQGLVREKIEGAKQKLAEAVTDREKLRTESAVERLEELLKKIGG